MNITDLIVERLQQGHKVDLPGIGTLDSVMQSPRHDEATHTYYPATRSIVFNGQVSGEGDLTPTIAERECVGVEVAKQMWRNYIDALGDKLKRSGSHQFGKLGTMSYDGQAYSFAVAEGLILEAGNAGEAPITDVKTYAFNANDDPFAQFEEDEPKVTPGPVYYSDEQPSSSSGRGRAPAAGFDSPRSLPDYDDNDPYDVYDYDDPEDFYYDNEDLFDDYEEAEDYYYDAWGE